MFSLGNTGHAVLLSAAQPAMAVQAGLVKVKPELLPPPLPALLAPALPPALPLAPPRLKPPLAPPVSLPALVLAPATPDPPLPAPAFGLPALEAPAALELDSFVPPQAVASDKQERMMVERTDRENDRCGLMPWISTQRRARDESDRISHCC